MELIPMITRFIKRKPLGAAGGVIILLMVFMAIFADLISTHDPTRTNAARTLIPPNTQYWFGTDH